MNNIKKLVEPTEAEYLAHAEQEELLLFASKDDYLAIANGVWELFVKRAKAYAQQSEPVAWQPISSAAKDGRLLRLLVNFSDNSLEDDDKPIETIGHNSFSDTGIDQWQFAGWNWQHDCYTEGVGTPVGWLPLTHPPATVPEGFQLVPIEPTAEMVNAFKQAFKQGSIWTDRMTTAVEAMLSASPTPPNAVPLEKYNKLLDVLQELDRALCVIGVVGKIDGYDVIRRDSVIDIARDRLKKAEANLQN